LTAENIEKSKQMQSHTPINTVKLYHFVIFTTSGH